MKVTKNNLDNYEVELTIELEAEQLTKAKKTACKQLAERYTIHGFRKGKAPQHIVEQQLGKDFVMEETAEILIYQGLNEALKSENLIPFTEPKREIITNEEGKDFVFKAIFTPYPEVKLGEYKNLEIEKHIEPITDEDVEEQIEVIRDHHATLVDVDEDAKVENGDFITLDFEGFINGEAFEGGLGKSHPLTIGSGTFIPGFEDQLIGLKVNEEKDVNVTFPEDYHDKKFAGKDATFKCKIISHKHRQVPELNDEFVKQVNKKYETVDDFKADVKKTLEISAERKATEQQNRDLIDKVRENMTVDVPPVMIDDRVTKLITEFTYQLQSRGMTIENYMQATGNDMDQIRESYKEAAKDDVYTELMLEAVAEAEGIEVTPKEFEYEIAMMAATYRATPKQVFKILKDNRQFPNVNNNIRRRKAMKFLIDNMKKDETEVKSETETKSEDKND